MNEWSNFFTALVGASATLTGLIFVGVSISLAKILEGPTLPGRAAQSLTLLIIVLIISVLCLVPGQSLRSLGIEILSISILLWIVTFRGDLKRLSIIGKEYKKHAWLSIIFTQLAVIPYLIAAIISINYGIAGIYWLIPAMIFSIIKAVLDGWVLLVEINR